MLFFVCFLSFAAWCTVAKIDYPIEKLKIMTNVSNISQALQISKIHPPGMNVFGGNAPAHEKNETGTIQRTQKNSIEKWKRFGPCSLKIQLDTY